MKILIIEDEILIQKSLTLMLKKKGIEVDATASGKEAIKFINNNNYDRIICDLMLNDITGFDIIEESKKKFNADEIKNKYIIITAYSSEQTLEKASKYGCRVLSKPFKSMPEAIDVFIKGGLS